MAAASAEDVKVVIASYLTRESHGAQSITSGDLNDDLDLLTSGMVDSLGVFGLINELQAKFGEDIDFEDLDPDDMTIVGPLSRYVADHPQG